MNLIIICIFLLINGVRLESCNSNYTDLKNNNVVDIDKECNLTKPCLVKCCGVNEVIYLRSGHMTCKSLNELAKIINLTTIWESLTNYSDLEVNSDGHNSRSFYDFRLLHKNNSIDSKCSTERGQNNMILYENGYVYSGDESQNFSTHFFCVDKLVGVSIDTNETMQYYYYFLKFDDGKEDKIRRFFVAYASSISSFFMLLVLIVYGMIRRLSAPLHGKLLMSVVASLMLHNLISTWQTFHQYKLHESGENQAEVYIICKWLKPIAYFLLLSTFTWLSTLSFDIYMSFRETQQTVKRKADMVKYLKYSLYAAGVPALITTIVVLIDNYGSNAITKPGFDTCLSDDPSKPLKRLYIYLPSSVMVLANTVFFAATACKVCRVKRDLQGFNRSQKNPKPAMIFMRLSVIMGINWIIEMAQGLYVGEIAVWLFILLNIFNISIGVIIFILMVCKKKIFVELCIKFGLENRWTRSKTVQSSTYTDQSKRLPRSQRTNTTDDSIAMQSVHNDSMKVGNTGLQRISFG